MKPFKHFKHFAPSIPAIEPPSFAAVSLLLSLASVAVSVYACLNLENPASHKPQEGASAPALVSPVQSAPAGTSEPSWVASGAPILAKAAAHGLSSGDMELIRALNGADVMVAFAGPCKKGMQGAYLTDDNLLLLCTDQHGEPDAGKILSDTLRHEAVHAAQDCLAGINNDKVAVLFRHNNPFLVNVPKDSVAMFVLARYQNRATHPHEWEAFTIAHSHTSEEVAKIVRQFCS
jgi:hypothetical protein